jgi:hypothetical protein
MFPVPGNPSRWFRRSTVLLVVLSLSLLLLAACGPNPTETPVPSPSPLDNSSKVDSVLVEIFLRYTTAQGSPADKQKVAIDYARERGVINQKDEVEFELELEDPNRAGPVGDKVKAMGGRVIDAPNIEGSVKMRVAVPVNTFVTYANSANKDNFLRDLADFQGVKSIHVVMEKEIQELSHLPESRDALLNLYQTSVNEGVKVMGADKWQAAGFRGKGVKIGVIDGGFKFYQEFLGKTLPADLDIRDEDKEAGEEGVIDETVHGTAVLEILYSLAPEAEFHAVAADLSDNEIATALDYLISKGVNIISMSIGGHTTAGDGTDPLSRKIEGLRRKGILFFVSAGNEGDAHYVGNFDPDEQGFQQWQPGVTRMAVGNLSSVPYDSRILLNWEQWNLKARTDLDLYLEDKDGNPVGSSLNDQRSREPRETVLLKTKARSLYYIKVRLKPGTPKPDKPFRLHIFTHDLPLQFFTPVLAVANPADSKGALAVGAVDWDKDSIAYYSSQGPLTDGTFKPEISAPAGVTSRAYEEEGESNFDGTSAACPEAAGLAALIKSAKPGISADDLARLVLQDVKDLGASGPDTAYGFGRADLSKVTPGDVTLKSNLPPLPAPNPDPALKVATSKRFPAPVAVPVSPQPNATKGPPTETPLPLFATTPVPAVNTVTFKDDFQNSSSGLPDAGPTVYENGAYRIKADTGQLVWSIYPDSTRVQDFSAEVKVQGINDKSGIYGLIFWWQSPGDYYMLSISGTGQLQVSQFNSGQWKEIVPWFNTTGWKSGQPNQVRLVSASGQLSLGLNNKTIKTAPATGNAGGFGFAAAGYAQSVRASFSDFKLSSRS